MKELPVELEPLVAEDQLSIIEGIEKPAFIHRSHRWVLVLLRWAQLSNVLPYPCKVLTFDYHSDRAKPRLEALKKHLPYELSVSKIIDYCRNVLAENNGDWIVAGMELGLISDVIAFGVEKDRNEFSNLEEITDSRDVEHKIFYPAWPGEGFNHHGWLVDDARDYLLSDLWEALDWNCKERRFNSERPMFLLDFDLDCFSFEWHAKHYPWLDNFWERFFGNSSAVDDRGGSEAKMWMEELILGAGMLSFATEPCCCGGDDHAQAIWEEINRRLFNGRLIRRPLPQES